MTQTVARLHQRLAPSYSAGLVSYRRFGRPSRCFDTICKVRRVQNDFLGRHHLNCGVSHYDTDNGLTPLSGDKGVSL